MRQILIGPLLDDRLKWGTPKARKGQPLSLCVLKSYGFRYRPDIQPIFKYVDTSVLILNWVYFKTNTAHASFIVVCVR